MAAAAIAGVLLGSGVAFAQQYAFDTDDTPIFITVAPDGSVTGTSPNSNPQRTSAFYGHINQSGTIEGIWVQAVSNSMCTRPRQGSYAWGLFVITNPGDRHVYGMWGYCDARPNHSYNLRPRQ